MSSIPQLRPYQRDVIARVEAEIAAGHRPTLSCDQTAADLVADLADGDE
jgi:hypothetical protein